MGSKSLTILAGASESESVSLMSIDDAGDGAGRDGGGDSGADGAVIGRRSLVVEDNDEPGNMAPTGAPVISGRAYADQDAFGGHGRDRRRGRARERGL